MNPKISIIVPIYNVEEFLSRCIESVINQTYNNLEIILVDDGSPDKCPEICDSFAKEDSRIRVIHKNNGGLSDARNAGIDIATGEYIMFVDSDDYVELDLCDVVVNSIRDGYDIYAYHFRRFVNFDKGDPYVGNGAVKYINGRNVFDYYINRKFFSHMVCDKVFKRSLFEGVRFIKGRLAEDLAICYQLFGKCNGAAFIDRTFYNYYTREDSIMGQASLKLCIDAYKGECEAYSFGNDHFPEYSHDNDVRLLNQSMKTYLKLKYIHNLKKDNSYMVNVYSMIRRINKSRLPLSTELFYILFCFNKRLAWYVHKIMKLS